MSNTGIFIVVFIVLLFVAGIIIYLSFRKKEATAKEESKGLSWLEKATKKDIEKTLEDL